MGIQYIFFILLGKVFKQKKNYMEYGVSNTCFKYCLVKCSNKTKIRLSMGVTNTFDVFLGNLFK